MTPSRRFPIIRCLAAVVATAAMVSSLPASDIRIKDLTHIDGIRDNNLVGLGLVVGLNNTGGKSPITRRLVTNMVQQFGIRLDPDIRAKLRLDTREKTNNVAVVSVTAVLPAFRRPGQKIDVLVSAIDDSTSLAGGQLLQTPLFGADDEVYAVAQGAISVDAFTAGGAGAKVQKNYPNTGRITDGANVELSVATDYMRDGRARFLLRQPDFETAARLVRAVNETIPDCCRALDPGTIEVQIPHDRMLDPTSFLADVGAIRVSPDTRAVVVINERTGTIVIGENVRLSRALVTHANLAIFTKETPQVSQPNPLSQGQTTVVPRTQIDVVEEDRPITDLQETATVGDLAQALNALGVPPRDLGVIFQQLKDSGALHADLEFK
jgi:flagellar P-ring protein precursor FlgI